MIYLSTLMIYFLSEPFLSEPFYLSQAGGSLISWGRGVAQERDIIDDIIEYCSTYLQNHRYCIYEYTSTVFYPARELAQL